MATAVTTAKGAIRCRCLVSGSVRLLRPIGQLRASTACDFLEQVLGELREGSTVILDVSGLQAEPAALTRAIAFLRDVSEARGVRLRFTRTADAADLRSWTDD